MKGPSIDAGGEGAGGGKGLQNDGGMKKIVHDATEGDRGIINDVSSR